MKKTTLFGLATLFITLQLTGCGGGGGEPPRQQKTAILTFGVISTATLSSVPINAIKVTASLPSGVTVPIKENTANEIDPSALKGLKNAIVLGSYSASVRKITIGVIDNSSNLSGIGLGDFARLTLPVTPGTTLSENDFTNLNNPFPFFEAVGFSSGNSVVLDKTKPTLKVDFGF